MKAEIDLVESYVRTHNLKMTDRRKMLLSEIIRIRDHFDADSLYLRLKRKKKPVSRATVYRTLDLFEKIGIVEKASFGGSQARYEHVYGQKHHDHLVCGDCGTLIEFRNERIEDLQAEVCRVHGFRPTHHLMQIFGICKSCMRKES